MEHPVIKLQLGTTHDRPLLVTCKSPLQVVHVIEASPSASLQTVQLLMGAQVALLMQVAPSVAGTSSPLQTVQISEVPLIEQVLQFVIGVHGGTIQFLLSFVIQGEVQAVHYRIPLLSASAHVLQLGM